jgi:hypothetical protein
LLGVGVGSLEDPLPVLVDPLPVLDEPLPVLDEPLPVLGETAAELDVPPEPWKVFESPAFSQLHLPSGQTTSTGVFTSELTITESALEPR